MQKICERHYQYFTSCLCTEVESHGADDVGVVVVDGDVDGGTADHGSAVVKH